MEWGKLRLEKPMVRSRPLLLILILIVAIFFIYQRSNKPDESLVNGSYVNTCCNIVTMRDGKIEVGGKTSTYQLENMKFGLTAYVDGVIERKLLRASPEETSLRFSWENGKRAFRTIVDGREYVFVRAR